MIVVAPGGFRGEPGSSSWRRFADAENGKPYVTQGWREPSKGDETGLVDGGGNVGIIALLILGLIAGAIAKAILPGDDPGGIIVTMIIGVAGALIGGWLASLLFNADPMDEFFDLSTWLTAIIGSIVLLLIYRAVAGNRTRRAV
jgi:uncharacterized membrane protein YeaQ/YmgE (transglycosylase-associated protein family)